MTDDEAHYSGIHEDDPDIQSPSEDESLDLQVEASVISDPYISNDENNEDFLESSSDNDEWPESLSDDDDGMPPDNSMSDTRDGECFIC